MQCPDPSNPLLFVGCTLDVLQTQFLQFFGPAKSQGHQAVVWHVMLVGWVVVIAVIHYVIQHMSRLIFIQVPNYFATYIYILIYEYINHIANSQVSHPLLIITWCIVLLLQLTYFQIFKTKIISDPRSNTLGWILRGWDILRLAGAAEKSVEVPVVFGVGWSWWYELAGPRPLLRSFSFVA